MAKSREWYSCGRSDASDALKGGRKGLSSFEHSSQAGAGALNALAWMAQERVLFLPVLSFFLSFLEEEMGYVCQTQKSNVCTRARRRRMEQSIGAKVARIVIL